MPDILHFHGRHDFDPDQMIGPDFGKRWLGIRKIEYDPDTDVTTVVLRGILPDEYRRRVEPLVAQQRARARIRELFIG